MNPAHPDIRWKQRFENFQKALGLLREALADVEALSQLEKEGAIQRFEFTYELAWKTVKDYLVHQGVALEQITPRTVVKQAFAAKIIRDGQLWIDMLRWRNMMSHTYDETAVDNALHQMTDRFLPALEELYTFLKAKSTS